MKLIDSAGPVVLRFLSAYFHSDGDPNVIGRQACARLLVIRKGQREGREPEWTDFDDELLEYGLVERLRGQGRTEACLTEGGLAVATLLHGGGLIVPTLTPGEG